uniref:Polyprotein n=1 Tax=Bemisia tabaci iflavirus 1 TaxID=2840021 RepID=A0A8E8FUW6_9VIRU|nr:polyprotein [Bemisia tabaci iflavirus 1]
MCVVGQTPHPRELIMNNDEMLIEHIVRTFGLVKILKWSFSDAAGTLLDSWPAAPLLNWYDYNKNYVASGLTYYDVPPVGVLSLIAALWRGSLEFRLDIVGTQFIAGRLMIGYVTRQLEKPTMEQLKSCPYVIFDVQGENLQKVISIPFNASTPFWRTSSEEYTIDAPAKVYVYVLNSLVPMDNVAPYVYINVYMRAGPDFELAVPVMPRCCMPNNYPDLENVSPNDIDITFIGNNYVEFEGVLDNQYSTLVMDLKNTTLSATLKLWSVYNFVQIVDKDANRYRATSVYVTGLEAHVRHYLSTCYLVYGVSGAKDENQHLMFFTTKSKASKYAKDKDRKDWERITDSIVRVSKTVNYTDALACQLCTIHEVSLENAEALPIYPEMDERDRVSTSNVNVLATLPSTNGGATLFGERLYHLKQLFRKYVLYTRGMFKGGVTVAHGFNIPLLYQGRQRTVVEMRNYPDYNFNRGSVIEDLLYGFYLGRGGMRMRIVVRCDETVTFRIEHRPDEKYSSVPKEGIDLLFNDNYNYIMQDTNVNNIAEIEIPFYNSGLGNFLQRPKEDASLESFHYCLGNLYMGILPLGKYVDVHVDIYYCLGDDFHAYVFQGFPPIAAIPRLTNFTDLEVEPQMGLATWLLDQTGVSAVANKLDNAADELKDLTERTRVSAGDASMTSEVFLDTLKQMFPAHVAGVALQSLLQLAQVMLNPSASSIAIAFASVLTSVGLLCVRYVQQFISWFVKIVCKFTSGVSGSKRTETEPPPSDVTVNINIEAQGEADESYMGLTSVVMMSTFALLGMNAKVDSYLKGAPKLCLKGIGPFVRDVMWITNFLNANLAWIMRVVRWVGNKLFPDTALAREIAMQELDLTELFQEMDCLLSENNRLKIEREPSWSVRLYKAAARASIVRAKLMVSKKIPNTAIFNRIDALIKLRDDMIRMTSSPPVRFEPYTIWIAGESNVGKSRMINGANGIAMSLLRHIGLTTWEEPCYVRTPGNPYWNGCRNQPVCVYDEFAALGGEHGVTQVAELFCLKSKAIFNPPQAEIKDKNIRYNPKLVIMASNQTYPQVTGVNYEKAFHRRRDALIYVSRNEAFYKQHNYELDLPPHLMDEDLIRNYEHLEFQFLDPIVKTQPRTDRLLSYDQMISLLKTKFQRFHDREMNEYIDNLDAALTLMPGSVTESVEDIERDIYQRLVDANKYRYSHLPETREFLGCAFEEIKDDINHRLMPIVYAHLRFLKDHFKREYEQYYNDYPVIKAYERRLVPQMMEAAEECVCTVNQFTNDECRPCDAHIMCNICHDASASWEDRYLALAACQKAQHVKVKHAMVKCCVHKFYKPCYTFRPHVNIIIDGQICSLINVFEGPHGYIPVYPCFGDCVWSDEKVRAKLLRDWLQFDSSEREYIRNNCPDDDLPYNPMTKTMKIVKVKEQTWLSWATDAVTKGCAKLWELITNLKLVIGAVAVLASIGGIMYLAFKKQAEVSDTEKGVEQEMFISGDFRAAGKKGKQTKKELIVKQIRGEYVPQMGTDRQFTILRYVQRNACFIVAESETSSIKGRLLGFADRFALGPSHYMDEFHIRRNDSKFYIVTNGVKIPVLYDQFKCEAFDKSGLGVYTLPVQVAPFKNILTHFAPVHCHESVGEKAYMLEYSFDLGSVIPYALELRVLPRPVSVPASGYYKEFIVPDGYTYRLSKKGLCGSVLLSENLAEGIIGMHVAGASNSVVGFSEMITREQLLPYLNRCKVIDVVEPELSPYVDELKPEMGVSVLGVVDRRFVHRESGESKIIPTECHGEIFNVYCDVPVLSPKDERIQGAPYSPLKCGVDKHGHITLNFPQEYIDIAAEDMRRMLLAYVRPARLSVGKLTKKQAITGIPDLVDYDKLNFNTSEGFPFSSLRPGSADSKRWLFNMHQDERGNYIVDEINDIVLDVCQVRKMQRLNRILPFTVFTDCLKDQKVAKEKVCVPGKVRIFSISDVAYTIQSRQYFMDFTVAYQQSRFKVEHMIGINADSDEWGRLAAQLLSKGDNIVTADYSNFGPNLNLACAVKFIDIVNEWYSIYGECTDAHNVNREMLFYEVMHSLHLVYGTIYRTFTGLPSGGPLTTIQNSFVNCMYIRVVWLIKFSTNLEFKSMEAFHLNVELYVYGDDIIQSVTDLIKEEFNCRDIAQILSQYGIVIKNATKLDEIKPYSKLMDKETTFLKRGFQPHPFRPLVMLAPLAVASVEDTCNYTYRDWQHKMREISLEASDQTIRSAYGHGPDYYAYVFDKVSNYWYARGERLLTPSWREIDESIYG